ncbi:hypothetical protein ZWY2020_056772 [Hordeum vulgare]|nr:hypothetical protein ZWY2020_056772 [Hordeum vulgare]
MVSGYAQNGRHEEAVGAFLEMWEGAGVQPNELTVSSVLPVCVAVGAMELGMKVEEYARGKGHLRNVFVTNALLEISDLRNLLSSEVVWRLIVSSFPCLIFGAFHEIRNNGKDICLDIAAKRDDLLSEVVEATSWLDIYRRGLVHEEHKHEKSALTSKRYGMIHGIELYRGEIRGCGTSGKSNLAQEYRISKMLTAVIDKASKFLSAGKTNLHGHAQGTSKRKDTLMVSHKPEETLDALSHEQMVQFSEKTSPNGSSDITNIWRGTFSAHAASGCISDKPKPQSASIVSACKDDVHGLTEPEPENHRDFSGLGRESWDRHDLLRVLHLMHSLCMGMLTPSSRHQ